MPTTGYDYVIGSLHSLSENANESVDGSPEITKALIENRFGGSFTKYAEEYFRLEADVVKKTDCDIIGHFDLVTKYNEVLGYAETDEYFDAAFGALDELLKYDRIFEINVGAMTRGYRKSPYPSVPILKRMNEKKAKIILNGDCHNKLFLGEFLEDIRELAKQCGFKTHFILTKDGFKEIKL
jgi:histidinol-phosphatase (PHP family)